MTLIALVVILTIIFYLHLRKNDTQNKKLSTETTTENNNDAFHKIKKQIIDLIEKHFDVLILSVKQSVKKDKWGLWDYSECNKVFYEFIDRVLTTQLGISLSEEYWRAIQFVLCDKKPTISYVQRRLGIGYNAAVSFIEKMEIDEIISIPDANNKRHIINNPIRFTNQSLVDFVINSFFDLCKTKEIDVKNECEKCVFEIQNIISGEDYEKFVMGKLQDLGFNLQTTPVTGDQGVDLIAEKGGKKIAIQCKFYSKPVGNKAVQEVAAGMKYYRADKGSVISNNCFTPSARKLATNLGIELAEDNNFELFK
jgi:HJR/Mrr/RecB family endonuclease